MTTEDGATLEELRAENARLSREAAAVRAKLERLERLERPPSPGEPSHVDPRGMAILGALIAAGACVSAMVLFATVHRVEGPVASSRPGYGWTSPGAPPRAPSAAPSGAPSEGRAALPARFEVPATE